MQSRGVEVDHSTINRWVLKYAPELDKRIRPDLRPLNDEVRVDQTYIKVKGHDYLKADEQQSETTELRHVLYLNNQVEQVNRFIKRLTKPGMGFGSFNTAGANLTTNGSNAYEKQGTSPRR